jgi:oxaloacetate decarboxylase (Na+ extruding) subunit alpha
MRKLRALMPNVEIVGSHSGDNTWGFKFGAKDVLDLDLELTVQCGVQRVRSLRGLLDFERSYDTFRKMKRLGVQTIAAFVVGESPIHTNELYEAKVREVCENVDVDWIMIKDSGGLLTPERTGPFVDAIKRGAGGRKITLHSHCMTAMAPRVYMIGAEHGVDELQCGIWPLAHGTAQPPMQSIVRNLCEEGFEVQTDLAEIELASKDLVEGAQRRGLPLGQPQEYDHFHYKHQIPGGMLSNLQAQLKENGLTDRFPELIRETARVREELGWPTMVTPYSQFVGSQALLNVVNNNRYGTVPDQIKMYCLGYYGKPLGPIDPNVLDIIMQRGSQSITETPEPVEPALPGLRRRFPKASDEELVLRYMCPEAAVEETLANQRAGGMDLPIVHRHAGSQTISGTLIDLIGRIAGMPAAGEVIVEHGALRLRVVN